MFWSPKSLSDGLSSGPGVTRATCELWAQPLRSAQVTSESEQQELLCTEIIIPCILHYSSLKVS